jgi:DNA-binding transcriptional regulator YhcF (GntR family)
VTITVTASELMDAIASAGKYAGDANAQTIRELVAATGIHRHAVMAALQGLQKAGRLQTHRVKRTGIDGVARTLPAYTILPVKRKK